MKSPIVQFLQAASIALLSLLEMAPCLGQTYPTKPIRFVVPLAAGGGADIVARIVGQKLGEALGQPVIIDNRGGGGTVIGTVAVANAPADGYTLLLGTATTHGINASLVKDLPYDPIKDFAPVSLIAKLPVVLVANSSLPVKGISDLVALAKGKPEPLFFSSSGNGSSIHLLGELLNIKANIKTVHVPYKGAAPGILALLAGDVNFMFITIPPILAHIESKKVRALAMATTQRSGLMPDVPTIYESGISGVDAYSWLGVMVPAGTPGSVIARLQTELVKIMRTPDVSQRLGSQGAEIASNTPTEFSAFIRSEIDKYALIVKVSGAKVD